MLTAYHKQYIGCGFHLFPVWPIDPNGRCSCKKLDCNSPGKHPIGTIAPRGVDDATRDVATIEQWWATWPDANIGIRTGAPSGIVVLDIDNDKGGWDSLDQLEDDHGELPETPAVATGGGGMHVYFKHPGTAIPNSAGAIAPGIDIRGDGGYVIAPPSGHVSGTPYRWPEGLAPGDVPLAEAPPWLFATPRRESPRLQDNEVITAGGRNDRLMRIGAAFRRYGLTESELVAALHVVNQTRCRPPLDESEVGRIADSVARYQPAPGPRLVAKNGRKAAPRIRFIAGKVVSA